MFGDILGSLGSVAPLIGGLIGGPPGAAIAGLIAKEAGVAPDALPAKMKAMTAEEKLELLRRTEEKNKVQLEGMKAEWEAKADIAEAESQTAMAEEKTKQAEITSDDAFVRRTRPWCSRLYLIALIALMFGAFLFLALDAHGLMPLDKEIVVAMAELVGIPFTLFGVAVVVWFGGRDLVRIINKFIEVKWGR